MEGRETDGREEREAESRKKNKRKKLTNPQRPASHHQHRRRAASA
jgi:hypothetical protein